MIAELADRLHELDKTMERVRKRIGSIRQGFTEPIDPDEVARLEVEFEDLGIQFVETYRAWSRQHDEG